MESVFPQIIANGLIAGSHYALTAAGLALLFAMFRVLSFSHGYMVMCGAYFYLVTHIILSLGVAESFLISGILIGLLQFISYKFVIKPFLNGSALLPFITTMVLGIVLENLIAIFFGVQVKSISTDYQIESRKLLGAYITDFQILTVLGGFFLLSGLMALIKYTSFGRQIRACSASKEVALSCGINFPKLALFVCFVSGAYASVAGIAIGVETNLTPTMGGYYTIKAFAAMVLGGMGSIPGAIIGSYLLAFIEHVSVGVSISDYSLPSSYKDAFSFFIIFLVLLLKPEGLLSWKRRKV